MTDRINLLEQYLVEEPNDPFIKYALALEYDKSGKKEKSVELMTNLVTTNSDYLPVYYQLGKLYEGDGRKKEAIDVYKKGIVLATSTGNHHTVSELRSALDELIDNPTI